nr:uncharacterized protein LOC109177058 [Ipomoea batatas]
MITMLETSASDGNPMTVDQVYDVVMGTRLGYIKGMGNGPKPQTSRSTRANTSHLEEQMKTTMNENSQLKTELADLKMGFQQYEELLAALAAERSNQNWHEGTLTITCTTDFFAVYTEFLSDGIIAYIDIISYLLPDIRSDLLPKTKDFQSVDLNNFDKHGNYYLSLCA